MTTSPKSVFVTLYLGFLAAASLYAAVQIAGPQFSIGWLGVALTTAPFLIFLSWITITKRRARTSARLPAIMGFAALGAMLALWSWLVGFSPLTPAALALLGFLSFLIYTFWYSDLGPRRSASLTPGRALPDFEVERDDGTIVAAKSWRGRPTVMIFYRGNWCPLCMAQIKETVAHYREIEAKGARVALISPQPSSQTRALARRHNVNFEFYVDRGNRAARLLGIDHPGGLPLGMQALGYDSDTVLPTVIVADKDGVVRWAHETDNYRVRPEPQTFLDALSAIGA